MKFKINHRTGKPKAVKRAYDPQKVLPEARKRRTAGMQKEVQNLRMENETLKAKHQLQQVKTQIAQAKTGGTSSGKS